MVTMKQPANATSLAKRKAQGPGVSRQPLGAQRLQVYTKLGGFHGSIHCRERAWSLSKLFVPDSY
jgi:hypothetical protein